MYAGVKPACTHVCKCVCIQGLNQHVRTCVHPAVTFKNNIDLIIYICYAFGHS